MIYLDNCATTRPAPEVVQTMVKAMEGLFANPSSLHSFGYEAKKALDGARRTTAKFLGARPDQVIFTSGGTEANNMALYSHLRNKKGGRILASPIDHPSTTRVLEALEADFVIRDLPLGPGGHIDLEGLEESLDEDTVLVTYAQVHNELGALNDPQEVNKIIRAYSRDISIHVDGVQALGKVPLDFSLMGADSFSFSGHKFHGPRGVGGLVVNDPLKFKPLVLGGGQEGGLRSGTENLPAILGMAKALDLLDGRLGENYNRVKEIKAQAIKGIREAIPDVRINSLEPASPYILHLSIQDTRGEVLLHILEGQDIYISTGSACSSNSQAPSYLGDFLPQDGGYEEGAIRIGFSHTTCFEEIEALVPALARAVQEVRSLTRR